MFPQLKKYLFLFSQARENIFVFPSKIKSLLLFPQVNKFLIFDSASNNIFSCGNKTKDYFSLAETKTYFETKKKCCFPKQIKIFYFVSASKTLCLFGSPSKKCIDKALNMADVRDQLISEYFEQGLTQKQIQEALEFRQIFISQRHLRRDIG